MILYAEAEPNLAEMRVERIYVSGLATLTALFTKLGPWLITCHAISPPEEWDDRPRILTAGRAATETLVNKHNCVPYLVRVYFTPCTRTSILINHLRRAANKEAQHSFGGTSGSQTPAPS